MSGYQIHIHPHWFSKLVSHEWLTNIYKATLAVSHECLTIRIEPNRFSKAVSDECLTNPYTATLVFQGG